MNIERFAQLAEAFGGDLRRWPASERIEAEAFLASDRGAAALLDDARTLDLMLDAWGQPQIAPALRDRVLSTAPRERRSTSPWALAAPWLRGAGLAAACAAGVVVGGTLAARDNANPATEMLIAVATAFQGHGAPAVNIESEEG